MCDGVGAYRMELFCGENGKIKRRNFGERGSFEF